MYDEKNERKEFIADERSDAVAKACDFFQVEEGALEIGEFEARSVYGLGTRAVIVAALRDRTPPDSGGGGRGGGDRERGGRGRDRDRGERGGRGRDRDRGERGGRGRDRDRDRGRDRDRDRDRDRGRGRAEAAEADPEPPPAPSEPSVGTAEGSLGEVGQFVLGVVERMDLGPFTVAESSEEGLLAFSIGGGAAERVAGRDGRAVDALQLLANQVASQLSDDPPRVVLDVEGDSDARDSRLETLARRVAKRALDTGRTVRLDAMNGSDRRMVHLALRDEEGVATMSTGEGRYRQVLVVPEGAPEYDEAMQESESASQRGAS